MLTWRTITDEEPTRPETPPDPPGRDPARGRAAGSRHDSGQVCAEAWRVPSIRVRSTAREARYDTRDGGARRQTAEYYAGELATHAGGRRPVGSGAEAREAGRHQADRG